MRGDRMIKKIWKYLAAAAMIAALLLMALFLYRVSRTGLRYVLNGCPDSRAMPALGELLAAKKYETCYFAYIREVPHEPHYAALEIDFEFDSSCDRDQLIREALEIRGITEQFMQEHPEEIHSELRVKLDFHDKHDASPTFVRFLNFNEDQKGGGFQSGGLMYGKIWADGASLDTLKDARGFTNLWLEGFAVPDDFSALDDMDTLQALSFNAGNKYTYPPEVLAEFQKQHPGCRLSGNLETVKDDEAS